MRQQVQQSDQYTAQECLVRLVPFFLTSILYLGSLQYTIFKKEVLTALAKALPVICLIMFVRKIPIRKVATPDRWLTNKNAVIASLIAGAVGDAFLVFEHLFIPGMIAFAIGHMFLIYTYGFRPLLPLQGITYLILGLCLIYSITVSIPDIMLQGAVPIYGTILILMFWRACARIDETFPRTAAAGGAFAFLVSDYLLGIELTEEEPHGKIMVMALYYIGQLGAALGALDEADFKED